MLVVIVICSVLLTGNNHLSNIGLPVSPARGGVQKVVSERWSAEFVDLADVAAVKRWARGMCAGLKLDEIARELDIEPTVASVAHGLTSGMPEPAEAIARKTCEEELSNASTEGDTSE
jgi:hypothetical protein